MELLLQRNPSGAEATLGRLLLDGAFECYTLEDLVREMAGLPVEQWKIAGETAIPSGRYKVGITMSARFHKELPILYGVPGFAGVRIHSGNRAEDTEGCILVGKRTFGETVIDSRIAFLDLADKIDAALQAGDEVWIDVRNAAAA